MGISVGILADFLKGGFPSIFVDYYFSRILSECANSSADTLCEEGDSTSVIVCCASTLLLLENILG